MRLSEAVIKLNRDSMFKKGGVYLLFAIISNMINLVIIPVYTNNMAAAEYGVFALAIPIQSLFSVLATLSVFSGMKRFFSECEDVQRLKNSAVVFILIWGSVVLAGAYLASGYIGNALFLNQEDSRIYVLMSAVTAFFSGIVATYCAYYIMQYRAVRASAVEILKLLLNLGIAFYAVAVLDGGVIGALWSVLLANALVAGIMIVIDIGELKRGFDAIMLKKMVAYGAGLGLGDVSSWVLTLIDRYFIGSMVGFTGVAVYSIGYKVGMLFIPLVKTPFSSIFIPYKFENHSSEDGRERIKKAYEYYCFAGWFVMFCICIMAAPAIRILATDKYMLGVFIVPFVAFSYFLEGLCEFYDLGLHVKGKTVVISAITGVSAVVNIALNIIMIPLFGIYGAAGATFISYFIVNLLSYVLGKRHYEIGIGFFSWMRYGITFIVMYGAYMALGVYGMEFWKEFLIGVLFCILYLPAGMLLGSFSGSIVLDILGNLRGVRKGEK